MKKFKYPVAYKGNSPDLELRLVALGYTVYGSIPGHIAYPYSTTCPYLLTDFGVREDHFGYNQVVNGRIECSNKELFLALAAMVDAEKYYKGELVVSTATYVSTSDITRMEFTKGKLYKVRCDGVGCSVEADDNGSINGWSYKGQTALRKATKEEIIKHFEHTAPAPINKWHELALEYVNGVEPVYRTGVDPFDAVVKDHKPKDINGYELKVGDTVRLTGPKPCTSSEEGKIIHVASNVVTVIVRNMNVNYALDYYQVEITKPHDNLPLPVTKYENRWNLVCGLKFKEDVEKYLKNYQNDLVIIKEPVKSTKLLIL